MGFANLHTHTYFSDGCIGPESLVRQVYQEAELEVFALTDHDTLSGIEPIYRFKNRIEEESALPPKRFIPGIELSTNHPGTGLTIHLLGFFPQINESNYQTELGRIDGVLDSFCRYRAENRALKDLDGRIYKAFDLDLDGIRKRYGTPKKVIDILRRNAALSLESKWMESDKSGDVIQHPISITYQAIVDQWEKLLPSSTREKIRLYVLKKDRIKTNRLTQIYEAEGLKPVDAEKLARRNQGSLVEIENAPLKEIDVLAGLALLQKAGSLTFLAHPAGDHARISHDEFDRHILLPLIENGLNGIEVYYPYDVSHREQSIEWYRNIADKQGLLISGGTDFHGDGRTGLSDIRLDSAEAEKILSSKARIIIDSSFAPLVGAKALE